MTVGVLRLELALMEARTLKEKRSVVRSFVERLRNRFNVAVTEVGYGDSPKRCQLGIATVNTESRAVHSLFDQIVDLSRATGGLTLLDYEREFF
jgi:uncharacterized protein YlxP (DUF503 family)